MINITKEQVEKWIEVDIISSTPRYFVQQMLLDSTVRQLLSEITPDEIIDKFSVTDFRDLWSSEAAKKVLVILSTALNYDIVFTDKNYKRIYEITKDYLEVNYMNIFVLDYDFRKNAEYHVDKHVVKMVLEYAQLLCNAHHFCNSAVPYFCDSVVPYALTHAKHPCTKWVCESKENYMWLLKLATEMCEEFYYRFDKRHKSSEVVNWCLKHIPNLPQKELTPFALAMPDIYKTSDAVESYRKYYLGEKVHLFGWIGREVPNFVKENGL